MAGSILRTVFMYSIFVSTVSHSLQLPGNSDFIANYSNSFLLTVPKNLPTQTTVLDLQNNSISVLIFSDFNSLSKLTVLNMSYNLIRELDSGIFRFNAELAFLDLSHNRLTNISGRFNEGLQHLDLSFNQFQSLSMCVELEHLIQLQYLGLGAANVTRSDLEALANLKLGTVFLELIHLSYYEPGSLQLLNTQKLQIVFPTTTTYCHFVLSDAVHTSETLEISNMNYFEMCIDPHRSQSEIYNNSRVSDITFNNVAMTWSILVNFFQAIWSSSVKFVTVNKVTLIGNINREPFDYTTTSIQGLTVQEVNITEYLFSQDDVYILFADMNIEHLTIRYANLLSMLCPSKSSTFSYLDFSNNALTDTIFQECQNLIMLETLILQRNKLRMLSAVSVMASHMASLKHLDVSHNSLQYELEEECHWPGSVNTLNVAGNDLTESVFRCLPVTVKKLDLNNNHIVSIPREIDQLAALEELNLASNRLKDLPDCYPFTSLAILNVAKNSIVTPSSKSLDSCKSVKTINAENNPFQCDCDIRAFVYREKQSPEQLTKWPESYQCAYPETLKGKLLNDFQVSEISCNTTLLIVLIFSILGVLTLSLFCLCKYLDIPWYIKMIWQWTQTRRRSRIRGNSPQSLQQNFTFHAFISYSEHDSSWVKECLLPNLEREDGSIQICQHERNFIPGRSIVENIINCIEKSYKSIFILSPNFIQSEWCHYELYFAHHKLFTENSDDLILILLEPIPKYIIPARYHKLKALMAQRTYLEWPKERGKHRLFWANLRAAIDIHLPEPDEELIT